MSLNSFLQQGFDFKKRIISTFQLEEDVDQIIYHKKKIINWIRKKQLELNKDHKNDKKEGLIKSLFNRSDKQIKIKQLQKDIKDFQFLKKVINDTHKIEFPQILLQSDFFQQIKESLIKIQQKIIPQYYGYVRCPHIQGKYYIKSKQIFRKSIQNSPINNLKLILTQGKLAHKYQRNLVQQIFGRVIRQKGGLSVMIKIQIESQNTQEDIQLYCYIEDLKIINSNFSQLKQVQCRQISEGKWELFIEKNQKKICIQQQSIIQIFLSEMIVIPVQTLVSNFVIQIKNQKAYLIKYHQGSRQEIGQSKLLKEHPSIRNPCFYFKNFIQQHQINIQSIKKWNAKKIYANFYESLTIMTSLVCTDFIIKNQGNQINSLCFNKHTFHSIWKIVHEIVMISDWAEQVILPLKNTVTLLEIINRFSPIFGKMIYFEAKKFQQYRTHLLTLQAQSFLTSKVSKNTIQQYKDLFISLHSFKDQILHQNKFQMYSQVYSSIMDEFDLNNCDIYQAAYFLNFISPFKIYKKNIYVHQSWKKWKTWKKIYKLKQKQNLPYLNTYLDIFAFFLGIDIVQFSQNPFSGVKNQQQTKQFLQILPQFIKQLSSTMETKHKLYLSLLFQKAFRYKKYQICNVLLDSNILINDFQQIFQFQQILTQQQNKKRQLLILKMQKKSPQLHRNLRWEQLMRVNLKYQKKDSLTIQTINYGQCIFLKQFENFLQYKQIENNLSRKDYMYDQQRKLAKTILQGVQVYFQYTNYPLIRQFYKIFFEKLSKSTLMPNFSGLMTHNGVMLHLIQCIPKGMNFQQSYSVFSESDLKNLLNKDELSQAIILSIALMPSKILLKNIIIVPADSAFKSIFMIDFKQFYRKNSIQKEQGQCTLKTMNCLFTFDQMHKTISLPILKKYAQIDIMDFVQNLFVDLGVIGKKINQLQKNNQKKLGNNQLLGFIFQKNFSIALTERLFKIQNCFKDCLQTNKSVSHMEILNLISSELAYFYGQIILSSSSLIERQKKMLDKMWKKNFVINCSLINFFSDSSINIEEPLNSFPNHYRKYCFEGPTQNLNSLYNQCKKFNVFKRRKFQSLQTYDHQTLQFFVRNMDLKYLEESQKKKFLINLQQKSKQYLTKKGCFPLSIIKLMKIDILKTNQYDFSYQRVKEVLLEDIKTNDIQLCSIIKKFENAIDIKLNNVIGISTFGQTYYLQHSLQMRNLKTLTIINCSEIFCIDLKCDTLQNLTIRNNPLLEMIYIKSVSLRNIDSTGSLNIKLQNIGIYILKGINVLVNEQAFDGNFKKLSHHLYSIFLLNILRFLLNRLRQSEVKSFIVITLVKLGALDEEGIASLIGVSNINKASSSLSNLLLKFNSELQRKIYFKLIQFYFKNKAVQSFDITNLSSNNAEHIAAYLTQHGKQLKKNFKEITICQSIKQNFQSFDKIFCNINLQKHIKINIDHLDSDSTILQSLQVLLSSRQSLEKIDIFLTNSAVSTDFFKTIFKSTSLASIYISQSTVNNGICQKNRPENLKELVIQKTILNNFQVFNQFQNLICLKICDCSLPLDIKAFYQSISLKSQLKILKFVNQKKHHKNLQLQSFFNCLKQLKKLKIINLSENYFTKKQLELLDQFLCNSVISQIILHNFYENQETLNFCHFFQKNSLKSLQIQFLTHDSQYLKQFINSLSQNKSIINLFLKTQIIIQSHIFQQLKINNTLQVLNSNQLIPTWLKKRLSQNRKEKSKIHNIDQFNSNLFDNNYNSTQKINDYYKIGLSMDGGGVRGLLLATELSYLCKQVGYPLHQIFDVIGGTSIGGILTLASTSTLDNIHPIMSANQLVDLISIHGKQIFKKSQVRQLTNLFDTKYSVTYIQNLMNTYFKDCKLSDTFKETTSIVTAVSRINSKDIIFKSTDAILNRDKDFYVKDIARATSAAPTYFPSAQIKNVIASQKYSLIDGGVGLNNPSKLVIDEVKKLAFNSSNQNNYFLLSLGTGRLPCETIPQYAGIKDLAPIIDSFTQSANYFTQRDLSQNYKGHFMRVSPLINLTKKQGQLDNTDPQVLKIYQNTGLTAAKTYFSNTIIFGKYRTMNLVEWLKQNTARKFDL